MQATVGLQEWWYTMIIYDQYTKQWDMINGYSSDVINIDHFNIHELVGNLRDIHEKAMLQWLSGWWFAMIRHEIWMIWN